MAKVEEVQLGELPETVIEAAFQDIACCSVGFVRIETTSCGLDLVLCGSGTLVRTGNVYAVLTAHHVVSILPTTGRLGLLLTSTTQPHTVETQGLSYVKIARGTIDADGPDLGAVVLGPSIAGSIAARKTFYNLDLRRDQLLHSPPHLRDGFWFVNGFIDENTVEEREKEGFALIKGFYNLSGAGGPEDSITVGEHDYFTFPVSYAGRAVAPKSFGGMSGGGLWQIPLQRGTEGRITHKPALLSGVVFYQEPTNPTSCGVRCHGRQSVYRVAYSAIHHNKP